MLAKRTSSVWIHYFLSESNTHTPTSQTPAEHNLHLQVTIFSANAGGSMPIFWMAENKDEKVGVVEVCAAWSPVMP